MVDDEKSCADDKKRMKWKFYTSDLRAKLYYEEFQVCLQQHHDHGHMLTYEGRRVQYLLPLACVDKQMIVVKYM